MNLRVLMLLCIFAIGSLFAITGLRHLLLDPSATTGTGLLWFGAQALPLVGVLPGILRLKARSYLLTVLLAMLFFCHGVWMVVDPDQRALGLSEVGFALLLVLGATFALRHLKLSGVLSEPTDGRAQ